MLHARRGLRAAPPTGRVRRRRDLDANAMVLEDLPSRVAVVVLAVLLGGVAGPAWSIWQQWQRLLHTARARQASYLGVGVITVSTGAFHHAATAQASPIATWAFGLLVAAVVVIGLMVIGLFALIADINRRLGPDRGPLVPDEGLEAGTDAPEFAAAEARSGASVRLSDFRGRHVVVAFLSPSCGPCVRLAPEIDRLARLRHDMPIVVVATRGPGFDFAREMSTAIRVVLDPDHTIETAFQVRWKPTVYVIDPEQKVALRTISNTLTDLEDMLDGIAHAQGGAPMLPSEGEEGVAMDGKEV